jgi:protein-L-isoaspartate(D-aspartate) O-methyltransferase
MCFIRSITKVQRAPVYFLAVLALFCVLSGPRPAPAKTDPEADPFYARRMKMVSDDLKGRGITDTSTLNAMRNVKRHLFVPPYERAASYSDHALPIGEGQTISQPYTVALMTEKLALKGSEKVLEIGTGSGYQAAVLAEIGSEVRTIEIIKKLADSARERLKDQGYTNVRVRYADGYFGWPEEGPFDAIIVTAAANHVPPPLLDQLKEGGRLIIPLGSTRFYQTLTLITKRENKTEVEHITSVVFVPMTGKMLKSR